MMNAVNRARSVLIYKLAAPSDLIPAVTREVMMNAVALMSSVLLQEHVHVLSSAVTGQVMMNAVTRVRSVLVF